MILALSVAAFIVYNSFREMCELVSVKFVDGIKSSLKRYESAKQELSDELGRAFFSIIMYV